MATIPVKKSARAINPILLAALLLIALAAVVGWFYLSRPAAAPAPESLPAPERVDLTLFSDPDFQKLVLPPGLPLAEVKLGRPNPFAALAPAATSTVPTTPY
ncbi:hypothetical protein EPN90_01115 [Patescibacteria group bacterium]|nr:MAG: hypothetical protein EPN90_01115 [Patescibacteria group bacterium]